MQDCVFVSEKSIISAHCLLNEVWSPLPGRFCQLSTYWILSWISLIPFFIKESSSHSRPSQCCVVHYCIAGKNNIVRLFQDVISLLTGVIDFIAFAFIALGRAVRWWPGVAGCHRVRSASAASLVSSTALTLTLGHEHSVSCFSS